MFGALSILYLSVFAFSGGIVQNFVSSVGSELCDVALKSVEKQTQTVKNGVCVRYSTAAAVRRCRQQPAGRDPVTDAIYLTVGKRKTEVGSE